MIVTRELLMRLNRLEREVQALRGMGRTGPITIKWVGNGTPVVGYEGQELIPVLVTGFTHAAGSGSVGKDVGSYTWTEQTEDQYGRYQTKTGGLFGSPVSNPLKEINGRVISTPFYAWVRKKGFGYDEQAGAFTDIWEFDAGPSSGGITDVCTSIQSYTGYDPTQVQLFGHDAAGVCTFYTVGTCDPITIIINTTGITGGTSSSVLYDNGGTVGELTYSQLDSNVAIAVGAIADGWH